MTKSEFIPDKLDLYVGGYPGASYYVNISGKTELIWSGTGRNGEEYYQHIKPSAQRWQAFRAALDTLCVWDWDQSYEPDVGFCDGTRWSVRIEYPDGQSVKSEGWEKYPSMILPCISEWTEDVHSPDWELFCALVRWMTEGCDFS
jgi:hypothetical protein